MLLLSALSGLNIVANLFRHEKRDYKQLSKQSVFFGFVAFLMICFFLVSVQAMSNSIEISSTSKIFDFTLLASVHFANGFWYSFLGLLSTILSYLVSNRLLGRYVYWIEGLTKLEPEKNERWYLVK